MVIIGVFLLTIVLVALLCLGAVALTNAFKALKNILDNDGK